MLHQMCFKNFVHFKEHQHLRFRPGINILVGQNSSGKTSILEMIRRCMTKHINNHVTSSYDPTKEAYLVCKFNIGSCHGKVLHVLDKETVVQPLDTVSTSYLLSIVQKEPENGQVYWKKSVCFGRNDKITVLVGRYKVRGDDIVYDQNTQYLIGEVDSLLMLQDDNSWTEDAHVIRDLKKIDINSTKHNWKPLDPNRLDSVLGVIEERYVSTTPMRSINPIQWSRSKHKSSQESQSCREAVQKAEILQALLNNEKEVDCQRAKEIFDHITGPLVYNFNKTGDDIIVEHKNENPKETKSVPLLKTPEGIIEAQQLALLLAHKTISTMCFEEPDRGMHPRMIEQLLQVLTEVKDKTLLVVTHSPYMINNFTANLTHVCVRRKECGTSKSVHTVHPLIEESKIDNDQSSSKITIDTEELKKILFSSQILCVEGKTDKIFVESIFEQSKKFETMKIIASHQILVMGSNTLHLKIKTLCSRLNVKCIVLMDRDAIIKINNRKSLEKSGTSSTKRSEASSSKGQEIKNIRLESITACNETDKAFFKQCEGESLDYFLKENFEKISELLQSDNIFIWKRGSLEDTISDVFKHDSFEKRFKTELKKPTICSFNKQQLSILAREMCESDEIKRLLHFFESAEKQTERTFQNETTLCERH